MLLKGASSAKSKTDHESMNDDQKTLFEALQSSILNFLEECESEEVFRARHQQQVDEAVKIIQEASCETPDFFFRLL